jgi:hypothetical protein
MERPLANAPGKVREGRLPHRAGDPPNIDHDLPFHRQSCSAAVGPKSTSLTQLLSEPGQVAIRRAPYRGLRGFGGQRGLPQSLAGLGRESAPGAGQRPQVTSGEPACEPVC